MFYPKRKKEKKKKQYKNLTYLTANLKQTRLREN